MNEIAFCVITYNRSSVVRDILLHQIDELTRNKIDIYIIDSSNDGMTEHVCNEFINNGYDNLYYVRLHPTIYYDYKVFNVLKGTYFKHNYKYIWPVKDRVIFSGETISCIAKTCIENFDCIYVNVVGEVPFGRRPELRIESYYDDPVKFYNRFGLSATSLQSTLFGTDLLNLVDWEEYEQLYLTHGEHHFVQYTLLFHALALKNKVSIKVLTGEKITAHSSRHGGSSWGGRTFEIFANRWVNANDLLSSRYNGYKDIIIRELTDCSWILGDYNRLMELKVRGEITKKNMELAKIYWERITDISYSELEQIFKMTEEEIACKARNVINEIDEYLYYKEYDKALGKIYDNRWIRLQNKQHFLMLDIIKILLLENRNGEKTTILHTGKKLAEIENNIMMLRALARRSIFNLYPDAEREMNQLINELGITKTCAVHVILSLCLEE